MVPTLTDWAESMKRGRGGYCLTMKSGFLGPRALPHLWGKRAGAINRAPTLIRISFPAGEPTRLDAVLIEADPLSGQALAIERVRREKRTRA